MNSCSNCRYWSDSSYMLGKSYSGELARGSRVCEVADSMSNNGRKTLTIYATAADDSDLDYCLITGPEFSCNLHEPKDLNRSNT